ncbi:MAG: hypothetical protein V4850_22985 [Myxococcota bacterium]
MQRASPIPLLVLLAFGACIVACIDPRSFLPPPTVQDGGSAPTDTPPPSDSPSAPAAASSPSSPAATHRLLGILDPERNNMVAFALKVPIGWEATQSFTRQWDGAVAIPQVLLRLRSPDGAAQIEYRPIITHSWSEGPMTQGLRQQKQQMGLDTRMSTNELEPMGAAAYARQVLIPRLAQEGIVLTDLRNEQEAPEDRTSAQEVNRRGSVDGTLPNGDLARVECRIRVNVQQVNGETYYAWSVVPSITQSKSDLDAAHAHTRIAQDSIIPNPEWKRLEQDAQQRGQQANSDVSRRQHEATMESIQRSTDAMTAGHNQRMADIQRQGDANTARYNDRMNEMDRSHAAYQERSASQDRQHEYRIDGIREESKYVDPTTGETVKVADGYDNVYRANNGTDLGNTTILATEAPLDPQQVDWQQLQRLSQQEY